MLNTNHKRILRNTGMLYLRMLLTMAVTLYTIRAVLAILGIEDFGIYHVVAGFVAMLGFLQGAMVSATQRYYAYDIGETGGANIQEIFNSSLQIHILVALLFVVIAETAGYWFVSSQLTIPTERMDAAVSAYHLTIAGFFFSVLMVPFTAMLMAHERMGTFSAIGILDVLLKLAGVILLQYTNADKLVIYALYLMIANILTFSMYAIAKRVLFADVKIVFNWRPKVFFGMLSYTAWNTWGNLASVVSIHGGNVLLNMFFGPVVNAGKTISHQANIAMYSFVQNLQAAFNPQIIKLYAKGNLEEMRSMVMNASKYNFYLFMVIALPIFLNAEDILNIWLVDVPSYSTEFLKLAIIASLIDSFSGPLMTSAQATGHIRLYHTVVGCVLLLNIPVSYWFLLYGYSPVVILVISVSLSVVALIARLVVISPLINLNVKGFLVGIISRSIFVLSLSLGLAFVVQIESGNGIVMVLFNMLMSLMICGGVIWFFGLNIGERDNAIEFVKTMKRRYF